MENESFDRVVSHTFLTSAADAKTALKEMLRVARPGGTVSSITSMSIRPAVAQSGLYPADWVPRYREQLLSDGDADEYMQLLKERRNCLLKHLSDNSIFEWSGSASILVSGRKHGDGESMA